MGRERSRLSRGLFGILAFILALGLVFYTPRPDAQPGTDAKQPQLSPAPPNPAGGSQRKYPTRQPMVSSAPQSEVGRSLPQAARRAGGGRRRRPKPSTQPMLAAKTKPSPSLRNPLVDGKAKLDAGDLLGARRILNAALISGKLSESDASQAKSMLEQISQSLSSPPSFSPTTNSAAPTPSSPANCSPKSRPNTTSPGNTSAASTAWQTPRSFAPTPRSKSSKAHSARRSKRTSSTWKSGSAANPTPTARCT